MPELPDVEVFRRYLNATALHQRIKKVQLTNLRILPRTSRNELQKHLKRHELKGTERHGKHLFVKVAADGWLMFHFGMTGFLRYYKNVDSAPAHVRLAIEFSNGYRLAFDNQRLLGQVDLIDDPATFIRSQNIGPDALNDLSAERFKKLISASRGAIKTALMNQNKIAGLGNIYSDEVLFQSRIHPRSHADELRDDQLTVLYRIMQRVLQTAIEARADPRNLPESFLIPRRRKDGQCPRCGGDLEQLKVSGRTAYVCSSCQKSIS